MRKISRRSFLKAATVACALTALTACGGGDESAAVSVAKDENGAYVDTLTITLGRFAEPSAAALFPEGQTFEDNAYTRYIESKLNVDLVDSFEAGGDAFTNQLATCVASGELPDIMTVISYDTFVEMVNNGLTYDMTDVYEEYASDYIKSLYDSYDGRCLSMATFDGRLMGIPGTNPDNSVPVLCWMRKDWLDKLGINPDPDGDLCITLDDIAAVAKAFVDANVGGGNHTVGMAFSGNDIGDAMCIANAMGGYIDRWIENPDGTMSWSTLVPEVKAAWAKMNEWYEEGILDPQFGTRTTDDINAMMINNELGIVFGAWHIPDWRLSSVKALVPEAEYMPIRWPMTTASSTPTTKTPPSGSWWSARTASIPRWQWKF